MKTKLVLWGTNANDEKILVALQLRPKENKVDLWTFPDKDLTDQFVDDMLNKWRDGQEVDFPENNQHQERALSVSDSLLPEDIRVERGDLIQRAQTEWHFVVLSNKLNELYENELGDIKQKVDSLNRFSGEVFEELKGFWNKVQSQIRERNLLREHSEDLRTKTNGVFDNLKKLRANLDEEFRSASKEATKIFHGSLEEIEQKIEGGRLSALFEDLKKLQLKFRDTKLTKEHRSEVWERIDKAFKKVKEKRFGPSANTGNSAMDRLQRRYDGLINAIDKMEKSINRDKKDLQFQDNKINSTDGQLEQQIRQAKVSMIQERIRSKQVKFEEMLATKKDLDQRMIQQKEKDAIRLEKVKLAQAKEQAKEKIANSIKEAEVKRSKEDNKLAAAATAILAGKGNGKQVAQSVVEKVKEVAEDLKEIVEEVVDEIKETIEEVVEDVTDVVSDVANGESQDNLIDNAVDTADGIASISDNGTKKGSEEE